MWLAMQLVYPQNNKISSRSIRICFHADKCLKNHDIDNKSLSLLPPTEMNFHI